MPRSLSTKLYAAMARAYEDGGSLESVAAQFGRSRTAVKSACAIFGAPLRPVGAPRSNDPKRLALIRAAIEAGVPRRQVKAEFKVSWELMKRAMGEPEPKRKPVVRRKAKVNRQLADEVELAMIRDRRRMAEEDRRRAMLRAA